MAKTKKILEDFGDYDYVVGLDEVGRGPLAGPVVSAAVTIFDYKKINPIARTTHKKTRPNIPFRRVFKNY